MYDKEQIIVGRGKNEAQTAVALMVSATGRPTEKDDEENQWAYLLAGLLKINPFIIQRWEKLNKQVPPTLRIAIAQTGRQNG